jgi:archaellum component FlaC
MNQFTQWGPIAIIVAGYLLGIYFQNRRIDDLKDTMNKRFDDTNKRFDDMNRRQDDMRDLLKSEVKRLEEHIVRLDHPVIRER